MNREMGRKTVLGLVIPVIIVTIWFYVTTFGSIPTGILPSIPKVGETFVEMVQTGQLQQDLLVSLSRVLKGYIVSAVLGITLGLLMGMSLFWQHFSQFW